MYIDEGLFYYRNLKLIKKTGIPMVHAFDFTKFLKEKPTVNLNISCLLFFTNWNSYTNLNYYVTKKDLFSCHSKHEEISFALYNHFHLKK